ncbi:MAG: CRISPR-associated CARF protein Csa3 [Halodesulfurarchaeum sp.]|nr:CRISPR-associated CARF protein Csa3 [Halodesulfurarchaeum sp.]
MRTYLTPIGYDTRRVTRPVVTTGLSTDDSVIMIRPESESDTERANQAIADVEQLLHEIEPAATVDVERVSVEDFETTIRECTRIIRATPADSKTILSLGGGARDVLLPLTVASLALPNEVDHTLFFSDLDHDVRAVSLPNVMAQVPARARETLATIVTDGDWLSLTKLAEETDSSKSTVIRHVQDLESAGVIESDTSEKAKRVTSTLSGELRSSGWPGGR